MKNIINEEECSFLCKGEVDNMFLKNNKFSNITLGARNIQNIKTEKNTNASNLINIKIIHSYFEGSEYTYFNCITSVNNFDNSFFYNSSFVNCFRSNKDYSIWITFVSIDPSFDRDIFQNVTDEDKGGDYYFSKSSSDYIRNCIFDDYNNTYKRNGNETKGRGGVMWYNSSEVFECVGSNLSKCYSDEGDGFFISLEKFKNCS